MRSEETKLIIKKKYRPVKLVYDIGRIFFLPKMRFCKPLNAEIKLMSGHAYHGYDGAPLRGYVLKQFKTDKIWSVKDDQHNEFQIKYLKGEKPYARYRAELIVAEFIRDLYEHQDETSRFILTRRQCIIAEDMGLGKTLAEIEAREYARPEGAWYVAPRSALKAVEREFRKWNCRLRPEMMTYNGLVKRMKQLEGQDFTPPQWITFDESSSLKTPTSQRSQAGVLIADAIREHWGDDGFVVLMTGTPAPQSPMDWWNQIRVARPGYIVEGDYAKLKRRLAVLVDRDFGGGVHKHIEAWKDREGICDVCGRPKEDPIHEFNQEMQDADFQDEDVHEFKLATNEVAKLYRRMSGLVIVKKKKDCLDLPDKRYEQIELPPTKKMEQIARSLAQAAPSVAEALTRLRTLSDGFQYIQVKTGDECCPICNGEKEIMDWVVKPEFEGNLPPMAEDQPEKNWRKMHFTREKMPCIRCKGTGQVDVMARDTKEVACPKEDALKDLIDQHSEVGRLVTYAGFTGSVDRCMRIYKEMEWEVIRWDGRGIHCTIPNLKDVLELFQERKKEFPRVGFVGQPGAAGMGLTLTASPGCVYYSNTFNSVDRGQSEDRIHRLGMDTNRGATIYDLFHLPTDRLVYNNIQEKLARQDLSMGLDISMEALMESLHAI